MPKNSYAIKLQQKKAKEMNRQRLYTLQMSRDMAVIALNEAFGFGAERCKKFLETYDAMFFDFAKDIIADVEADPDGAYFKDVQERRLKAIMGKYYAPRSERYNF